MDCPDCKIEMEHKTAHIIVVPFFSTKNKGPYKSSVPKNVWTCPQCKKTFSNRMCLAEVEVWYKDWKEDWRTKGKI